ncbi:MAG: 50S ribosomal protein L29 [Candidatus Gastranaerophilales bacterium]|nr:50S ribosomal protein L29 [Candidatus Gastranaerophilales bacterium]
MKLSEIRQNTVDELQDKVMSLRKELFDLKIQKATFKLENVSEISKKKKLIAQIKTVLREKQLANK